MLLDFAAILAFAGSAYYFWFARVIRTPGDLRPYNGGLFGAIHPKALLKGAIAFAVIALFWHFAHLAALNSDHILMWLLLSVTVPPLTVIAILIWGAIVTQIAPPRFTIGPKEQFTMPVGRRRVWVLIALVILAVALVLIFL